MQKPTSIKVKKSFFFIYRKSTKREVARLDVRGAGAREGAGEVACQCRCVSVPPEREENRGMSKKRFVARGDGVSEGGGGRLCWNRVRDDKRGDIDGTTRGGGRQRLMYVAHREPLDRIGAFHGEFHRTCIFLFSQYLLSITKKNSCFFLPLFHVGKATHPHCVSSLSPPPPVKGTCHRWDPSHHCTHVE